MTYSENNNEDLSKFFDEFKQEIREKTIDDFVEALKNYFVIPHDVKVIEMYAEQLKESVN